MNKKPKVFLLHNMVTPYRLPLFEELNKKVDLTVYFCEEKQKDRNWKAEIHKYFFKYKLLRHFQIGPEIINLNLMFELIRKKYDIYIISENPENVISSIMVSLIAKIKNKNLDLPRSLQGAVVD